MFLLKSSRYSPRRFFTIESMRYSVGSLCSGFTYTRKEKSALLITHSYLGEQQFRRSELLWNLVSCEFHFVEYEYRVQIWFESWGQRTCGLNWEKYIIQYTRQKKSKIKTTHHNGFLPAKHKQKKHNNQQYNKKRQWWKYWGTDRNQEEMNCPTTTELGRGYLHDALLDHLHYSSRNWFVLVGSHG